MVEQEQEMGQQEMRQRMQQDDGAEEEQEGGEERRGGADGSNQRATHRGSGKSNKEVGFPVSTHF